MRHSAALHGPVRLIAPVLRDHDVPRQYDNLRRAFLVPLKQIDAVMVALELAGCEVDYQGAEMLW